MMMSCSMQRAAARAAARKRREGATASAKEGDSAEGENWDSVEPMEVLEGRAAQERAGANDGELEDKFSELDETSEDPSALR